MNRSNAASCAGFNTSPVVDTADAVEVMYRETALLSALHEEGTDEAMGRAENLREFLGAAQEFDLDRARQPPPSEESLQTNIPALRAPGFKVLHIAPQKTATSEANGGMRPRMPPQKMMCRRHFQGLREALL